MVVACVICALTSMTTSCSKDEPGGNPNQPNVVMQLKKISYDSSDNSFSGTLSNFVYDNQNRVVSYEENRKTDYGGEQNQVVNYKYNDSYIVRTKESENSEIQNLTFNLSGGLITSVFCKQTNWTDFYSYKDNKLIQWKEGDYTTIDYLWEKGNPIRETVSYKGNSNISISNYSYTDLPCCIGNLQSFLSICDMVGGSFCDPFLQQSGYFGILPQNLIEFVDNDVQFRYELNVNGYPTKITGTYADKCRTMLLEWK